MVKWCYEQGNKQTLFKCQRNIFHKLANESEWGRTMGSDRMRQKSLERERLKTNEAGSTCLCNCHCHNTLWAPTKVELSMRMKKCCKDIIVLYNSKYHHTENNKVMVGHMGRAYVHSLPNTQAHGKMWVTAIIISDIKDIWDIKQNLTAGCCERGKRREDLCMCELYIMCWAKSVLFFLTGVFSKVSKWSPLTSWVALRRE